jgi:hypothetical protein
MRTGIQSSNGGGSMPNPYGWHYPAGAENDPRAPWNQVEPHCEHCERLESECVCVHCPCGALVLIDGDDVCEDCKP